MLKSHIKIAWRSLKANKLYSATNILGLAISFTVVVLLFMFIMYEFNFDAIHTKKDHIYRVLLHTDGDSKNETWVNVPAVVAPSIKTELPGIKKTARLFKHDFGSRAYLKVNEANYIENYFYWGDNELLDIFNIKLVKGQLKNPIQNPNTIILSESTALKYFGKANPIGQLINVDNYTQLEVTAVYKDLPANNTLDCNMIASFNSTNFSKDKNWLNNASFETFCLFENSINISNANNQLNTILNKNTSKNDQWFTLSFQPFNNIHLYSASYLDGYSSKFGDIKEVKNLSLLAILILIIACINYVNLVTARSQKRNIDVGINKTLGATTQNMAIRFFTETAIVTAIALTIGLIIAIVCLPFFNQFVNQNIDISILYNIKFIIGLFVILIITTLFSGLYPALYLSKFSPKAIFNPTTNQSKITTLIRKGLVTFQFTASAILIISSLIIYKQLQFIQDKKLGFNPEGVVAISISAIRHEEKKETLLNEFKKLNDVVAIAKTQGYPGISVSLRTLEKNENDTQGINIQTNAADKTIKEVLKLNLIAGKMPKKPNKNDSIVEVVLNKKGIDYLGYSPENAIGKKIQAQLGNNSFIVGVVENFNFSSLRVPIGAYAFHNNTKREPKYFLLVKYQTKNLLKLMNSFKQTFNKVIPNVAFDYEFLNKTVQQMYTQEYKTARITIFFCGLAIFLGCLGLFALAAYMTEQRTKEIGIRKVLGASLAELNILLCKDFIILTTIGFCIATPIAWYGLQQWLNGFAYKTSLSWWVFILSGLAMLIITLVVVSFKTIATAKSNPVDSLQTK